MKHKSELDTPCLILDMDMLENNLSSMQSQADLAGKSLRPHAKTHKCSSLAVKQIETGAIGICAAKVSEAEVLIKAGLSGILVTGPVVTPKKIKRLVELISFSPTLMVVVDHKYSIDLLVACLREKRTRMNVILDMDAGLHRTGVIPAEAINLAEYIVAQPELCLKGIQAYAGQVQHLPNYELRKLESQHVLREPAAIFNELKKMTDTCSIFTGSGTGTYDIDMMLPEITELQVGSYSVMDAEYLGIGSRDNPVEYSTFSPALRLLTTVVSQNQNGFVTVDAGLKSLYKDGSTPKIFKSVDDMLRYDWFGDEYGKISCEVNSDLPKIGAVVELITSHCDPTINLFDRYHLVRGEEVVGSWEIDLRGCSQ